MSDIKTYGRQGKVWGWTQYVFEIPGVVSLWNLYIKPMSECSRHRHDHKHNMFVLQRGELEISVVKNSYDLVDVTVLRDGDFMTVPFAEKHSFHNRTSEPVYAMELYWAELSNDDIIRDSVGGIIPIKVPQRDRILYHKGEWEKQPNEEAETERRSTD